jgi:CHAT domain-containing protein
LLEYSLGEDQSYLWVVTADSLHSYALPGRAELEALARRAYQELSANNPAAGGKATEALGRMVLAPAKDHLSARRLLIVADGALQYLPFAALSAFNKVPLITAHEIVDLPSASALAALRNEVSERAAAPLQVAVLADPVFNAADPRVAGSLQKSTPFPGTNKLERSVRDAGLLDLDRLPASRSEAMVIYGLAGPGLRLKALDFDASRAMATSPELERYRIVHFASHTLLNSQHPELSGIVLSLVDAQGQPQDGFLQVHEIFNLKLNADLVVLSACQTALGREVHGEGLIGLTRAFMYAGAPRVVSSLWRVPDQATAELMRQFYRYMLVDNLRPAAALRKAQLSIARTRRWALPYYWAGFVLHGEWK